MEENQNQIQNDKLYVASPWKRVALILFLVVVAYLVLSSRTTLWDRDEPRFSRATAEMIETGNYLYPTFNEKLRPDKPILIYWLMSVPMRLFGQNAFACRFSAAVGTAMTCLFTFLIGVRLFNIKTALWAMVILATSVLVAAIGTFATADAVMLPWMTAAMAIFVFALTVDKMGWLLVLLMGGALGLGQLAKGPVALLPVLSMIVTVFLMRRDGLKPLSFILPILVAVLIGVGVFLAWAIPANNATDGQFAKLGLGHHVVDRMTTAMEGHGGTNWKYFVFLPYYFVMVIPCFFPWTLHLFGAVSAGLGGRLGDVRAKKILIGWIVPPVLVMTLVSTKLAHYVLFVWPALALLVAAVLTAISADKLNEKDKKWLHFGTGFYGVINFGLAAGCLVFPWLLPGVWMKMAGLLCGVILLISGHFVMKFQRRDDPLFATAIMLFGLVLFSGPFAFGVMGGLEGMKIPPKMAKQITDRVPGDIPLAYYEFGEPSLNFYTGRYIEPLHHQDALEHWINRDQDGVLIIPKRTYEVINAELGPLEYEPIISVRGRNYSKNFKEIEVIAVQKKAKNQIQSNTIEQSSTR